MIPKDAKERYHILQYWKKWKLGATKDAFGVSRRTLYRWQARLREAGGDPAALAARSRRPRRVRRPTTPAPVVEQIRRLRQQYPNLGKAKVHCMLRPWCEQRGLRCPSVSTIGRIIARAPDRMRLVPARLDSRGRPKPLRRVRKRRKPRRLQVEPLGLWAADTIERVRDGVRRYLLTLVDPVSRVAFAMALAGKVEPPHHGRAGGLSRLSRPPRGSAAVGQRFGIPGPLPRAGGRTRHHPLLDLS